LLPRFVCMLFMSNFNTSYHTPKHHQTLGKKPPLRLTQGRFFTFENDGFEHDGLMFGLNLDYENKSECVPVNSSDNIPAGYSLVASRF
jgi:hypothetical protein